MVLLDVSHPPAGATTLIVSLGIISKPRELVIIEVAVFLLVAQALVINRLAGLPYPLWNAGHMLALERAIPHDVEALEDSAFLLTIAWPDDAINSRDQEIRGRKYDFI